MSVRSLNKVQLIGNLTRDPELRYTPSGTAVCTFGLATNRAWTTQSGETKEETEFHRIVAWNKLGELCSQLLTKGRKVYVEGRLSTRTWTGQDNVQRTTTEIVIEDMIILDSRKPADGTAVAAPKPGETGVPHANVASVSEPPHITEEPVATVQVKKKTSTLEKKEEKVEKTEKAPVNEDINPDDIPF